MHTSAQVVNRQSIDLLCVIFVSVGGVGIFADTTDSPNRIQFDTPFLHNEGLACSVDRT